MKLTTPLFIVTILLFLVLGIQSQDLQISQGKKTKTFKAGHLIKVELPNPPDPNCSTCPWRYIIGRIVSHKNDTLLLQIKIERQPIAVDGKEVGDKGQNYKNKMTAQWPFIQIPSSSILTITKQGAKNWQPKNTGDQVGILLANVGVIAMLASIYTDNEQTSGDLVGFGVITTAAGLVTAAIAERKIYYIENPLHTKTMGGTWIIK